MLIIFSLPDAFPWAYNMSLLFYVADPGMFYSFNML